AVVALNIDSLDVDGWAPLIIGLVVIATGIALRFWAVRTLGRFFRRTVVVQEGHKVVTGGPYRWVRHPSYTGALISMARVRLAFPNLASSLTCLIVPGLAYIWRIPAEEAALQRGLGEESTRYMASPSRLIPGVW